jgi:Asp-tRNA(Asn)/Glu-tRNA(Gln) amidotransferase A subunit family amidase
MTINQYRAALAERDRLRDIYVQLQPECDGCVGLAASGPAPVGLHSTGDPGFAIPFTLLGVPVISVPALRDESLPLGLQVAGFRDRDAATFAVADWIMTNIITQRMKADA